MRNPVILSLVLILFYLPFLCEGMTCNAVNETCIEPAESRLVEGMEVYRDCWKYRAEMQCASNHSSCDQIDKSRCTLVYKECSNIMHGACLAELVSYSCSRSLDQSKSCPYIFDPDCSFVDEECAELAEDKKTCLKKKINYACLKKVTKQIKKPRLILNGEKVQPSSLKCGALCLDGSCIAQQKRKLNDDKQFNQAIAGLAGLKKIADTVNSTGKTVNIFGGREMSCDIKMSGYRDCCNLKGWGKALGDHCGAEAKNLADLKERGQCVKIGSYCKSKILGFCAIKRNKFCCFDSVVTKVFNQEGKKQLKRNNGTAKRANCQGFDIKELDAVDFRRADLKEVYEVLLNDIELPEVNMMKNNVIQNVEQGNNNNNDNQYFDEGR